MALQDFFLYIWLPLAFSGQSPDVEPVEIQISPATTYIESPLMPDGRVDYVEYLNLQHSIGVVPELNSAVFYIRAIGRQDDMTDGYCREIELLMGTTLFDESQPKLIDEAAFTLKKMNEKDLADAQAFNAMQGQAMDGPWQEEQIPLIAEWLKVNEPTLKLVEQAGTLPQYYMPLPHSRLLIETPLAYVQHCRVIMRLLHCRVMLRIGTGDYEGAARDLTSMFRLASKTGQGRTWIEGLVAGAFFAISESALEEFICEPGVDEKLLSQLQSEIASLPPVSDLVSNARESERFTGLQTLQYAGAVGPGVFLDEFSALPIREDGWGGLLDSILIAVYQRSMKSSVDWNLLLREANRYYDQLASAYAQPTYAKPQAALVALRRRMEEMEQKASSLGVVSLSVWLPNTREEQVRRLILSTILPIGVSSIHEAWTRGEVRRRVSPVGCAIARYRRTTGKYPANLEVLVPGFINKLPLDPYTDRLFHYRVNADRSQFAVFTFGPNGKDDNGASWGEVEGFPLTDDMGMHSPEWLAKSRQP